MNKLLLAIGVVAAAASLHAQQNPTNTSPASAILNGTQSNQFWSRVGNQNINGNNNIFGTLWNSPIYTQTAGVTRMRLSGSLPSVPALGVNVDLTGHFGIGLNGYFNNPVNHPLTMLHLEGANNTPFNNHFGGQYRPWMRVGAFMRENSDAMYVGLKPEGNNRADAIINWADDYGSDKLRFLFTTTLNPIAGAPVDPLHGSSINGYEFMRMVTSGPQNHKGFTAGYIGVGPLFTDVLPPMNRMHMNAESGLPTFLQISNVTGGGTTGTDQLATDGLKLGVETFNHFNGQRQTGYLQWQENTPFIVQTDWNNASGGVTGGERLRVTSVGALVNTEGSAYGGSTGPVNRTRIAISADGANPVTRPLSLLHLGFNTGRTFPGTDGWRPWMELGMFTSNGSDNVYLGLKPENSFLGDRHDAVLSWGDNQIMAGGLPTGPDNFRMIFTSNTNPGAGGTPPATGANGLEAMRMTPTDTNGVFTGIGGDPTANLYGPTGTSLNPTATLEVNSWEATNVPGGSSGLRFTNLTAGSPTITNPGLGVLAVNKLGDVIYVPNSGVACWDLNGDGVADPNEDINGDTLWNALDCQGIPGPVGPQGPSGTLANNGNSMSLVDTATVVWGQDLGQVGDPARLQNTREIPMNGSNVLFTDNGDNSVNRMGLGTTAPGAKLDVRMTGSNVVSPVALQVTQLSSSSANAYGAQISVTNQNANNYGLIVSGFNASDVNRGVFASAQNGKTTVGGEFSGVGAIGDNTGLIGRSIGGQASVGIKTRASGGTIVNTGVDAEVHGNGTSKNIGYDGRVFGTSTLGTNITVNATVSSPGLNYCGKFQATGSSANDTYGLYSTATGSGRKFGLYAHAAGTGMVYGVKAYVQGPGTRYGVMSEVDGGPGTKYAGWFSGANVYVNGAIVQTSDSTLKTNVAGIQNATAILNQLNPVGFEFKQTGVYDRMNMAEGQQYGLIAQEVESVLPALVQSNMYPAEFDSLGNETAAEIPFKTLTYDGFIPFLIKGFQEQQAQIDSMSVGSGNACCDSLAAVVADQQNQIDALSTENNALEIENDQQQQTIDDLNARLSNLENCLLGLLPTLCQLSHSMIQENTPEAQELVRKQLSVVLSNRTAIILDQNVPNPFAEQTVINFSIPESVVKAQIHFYSFEGKLMQSVDIAERGLGSLTVFGSDLSSGTYTYTLVADGKVVATKKMVKQ